MIGIKIFFGAGVSATGLDIIKPFFVVKHAGDK
jgi:hypothetical protein